MPKFVLGKSKKKPFEGASSDKGGGSKSGSVVRSSFWGRFSFLKWVDPFTYVDLWVQPRVKRVTNSSAVEFIVNAFFALLFAFLIYTVLGFAFGTSSPFVIVYSGSMEPSFFRGDVMGLFRVSSENNFGGEISLPINISNVPSVVYAKPIYSASGLSSIFFPDINKYFVPDKSGDVVVYNSFPYNIPIIHRSILLIHALDGDFVLTKGDNELTNPTFDADCGAVSNSTSQKPCITFFAVPVSSVQGRVFFIVPKVGCVKLWLFDDLFSLISTGSLPKNFSGIC